MKLTRNHYYGKKSEMPRKLPPGATYMCSDEDTLYHAREDGLPIKFKVNQEDIDALLISNQITGWQDFSHSASQVGVDTPQSQTNISGGEIQLLNDNQGVLTDGNTNFNSTTTREGVLDLYKSSTNTFEFKDKGLNVNDTFELRVDLWAAPNSVPSDLNVLLKFYDDIDAGGNIVFTQTTQFKTYTSNAGVFLNNSAYMDFFLGESIKDGSMTVNLTGTTAFEVYVIGYNIKMTS